jgi:hypothetical protein
VATFIDGAPKHVSVILADEAAYNIAITAHKTYELFQVRGTLVRLARGWELLTSHGAALFTAST